MVHRLAELSADLEARCRQRGWPAHREPGGWLRVTVGEAEYIVDVRETTGPIYWRNLEGWIRGFDEPGHLVLLAMGFFPQSTLVSLIRKPGLVQRVTLMGMGQTSYFETDLRPRKFGETMTPVFEALEEAMVARGLVAEPITCGYCSGTPLSACQVCDSLICKSHFLLCPLCRAHLCHPDVNDCYFKHQC